MKLSQTFAFAFALAITIVVSADDPMKTFRSELPPGVIAESTTEVSAEQRKAIGQKLGGRIERLQNSVFRVHGRSIQVNTITAVSDTDAQRIHATLSRIKSYPFCARKDHTVFEFVGNHIDAALAIKTSYELGIQRKPDRVRYRVTAELATIETADYMEINTLFNRFLSLQAGENSDASQQIRELSKKFAFGNALILRDPTLGGKTTRHSFQPTAEASIASGATVAYSFNQLAARQGVPFVTATIEITVDDQGFCQATAPREQLVAATPFWPANDENVMSLAKQITAGRLTNDAKVAAILEWLAPGRNLKYSGKTGSRWGTRKVLEQGFGHCWDFSDCFITLARAAGVPSRQVAGWLYGSSGHVWAEYYRDGKGWQQVDPTGGGDLHCGIYHIPYFTSEDGEMPILYVSMPQIETEDTKSP